ncbi:hypothetical protein FHX42_005202 [Saccharopolyspora lacisalsi]|uniref:Mce-associated membrane protein n=1 Tax=Halosaccharopolyspora lacisalsi TaxID=1000566 RepID=A0A839E7B1_9PSEU|nr:hypothetical protein [Halosaccharopolyspora lacisalsi]MBA8827795.1 hypothetical protein [Halosaccharopolyspora lacisalsi]
MPSRVLAALLTSGLGLAGLAVGAYWLGAHPHSAPPAPPPRQPTVVAPNPTGPTRASTVPAKSVCRAFAATWVAVDTRRDSSPQDARRRAATDLGTPALQDRLTRQPKRPPEQWAQWQQHVHIQPHPQPYIGTPPPADTAEQAFAAATVARTAVGPQTRAELAPVTVYCTLTRHQGQWRVDDVDTDLGEAPA